MEGSITHEELNASRTRAVQALAKAKRVEAKKMKNGYRYVQVSQGTYVLRKV